MGRYYRKLSLSYQKKLRGQKTVEDLFGGLPRSLDKQPDFITAKCELWMGKEDHIKAENELKNQSHPSGMKIIFLSTQIS